MARSKDKLAQIVTAQAEVLTVERGVNVDQQIVVSRLPTESANDRTSARGLKAVVLAGSKEEVGHLVPPD